MVSDGCGCLAQSNDLGVSGGIFVGNVAIPASADDARTNDAGLVYHDCADGNFAGFQSALG
jgi:hypothetical protein